MAQSTEPSQKVAAVIDVLGRISDSGMLPDLAPRARAGINATRERCDAKVAGAKGKAEKLRQDAVIAESTGDEGRAAALRARAREVLGAANAEAAVELLDAQCSEYIRLKPQLFPYRTVEALAKTSLSSYPGKEAEEAIELRLYEWRARWYELQAAEPAENQKTTGKARAESEWRVALFELYEQTTKKTAYSTYSMPAGKDRPHTLYKREFRQWKSGEMPDVPRATKFESWLMAQIRNTPGGAEKLRAILQMHPTHSRRSQ